MPDRYNILENFFARADQRGKDLEPTWTSVARAVVAQFRTEAFQAGFGPRAQEVVEGLVRRSPEFRRLWSELDVGLHLEPIKTFVLPRRGSLTFEVATFSIDGHPGLKLVIFTPASNEDRLRVQQLLDESKTRQATATRPTAPTVAATRLLLDKRNVAPYPTLGVMVERRDPVRMNVVAVNGSPRKNSNTATLLNKAIEGARSVGAETELFHLYDLNFKGCTSCFSCKRKSSKNNGICSMKDELT